MTAGGAWAKNSRAAGASRGLSFCRVGPASPRPIHRRRATVTGIEPLIFLVGIGDAAFLPIGILAGFHRSNIGSILDGLGRQAARGIGPVI